MTQTTPDAQKRIIAEAVRGHKLAVRVKEILLEYGIDGDRLRPNFESNLQCAIVNCLLEEQP